MEKKNIYWILKLLLQYIRCTIYFWNNISRRSVYETERSCILIYYNTIYTIRLSMMKKSIQMRHFLFLFYFIFFFFPHYFVPFAHQICTVLGSFQLNSRQQASSRIVFGLINFRETRPRRPNKRQPSAASVRITHSNVVNENGANNEIYTEVVSYANSRT